MKANEFVKSMGLDAAKALLVESTGCSLYVDMNHKVTIYQHGDRPSNCDEIDFIVNRDDLKRLVESHELSDRLGGVETMLIMIEQMEINGLCDGMNISFDGEWQGVFTKHQLEQAIADVESCQ